MLGILVEENWAGQSPTPTFPRETNFTAVIEDLNYTLKSQITGNLKSNLQRKFKF